MASREPAGDHGDPDARSQKVIGIAVSIKHSAVAACNQDRRPRAFERIERRQLLDRRINEASTNLKRTLQMRQELGDTLLILVTIGDAPLRPMNPYRGNSVVANRENRPDHMKYFDPATKILTDLSFFEFRVG